MQVKHLLTAVLLQLNAKYGYSRLTTRYLKKTYLALLFVATGNLAVYAQNFDWVKGMGGTGVDQAWNVAADGKGNVYVTGYFDKTANFDPIGSGGTLTATGGYDVFLVKYDAGGNFVWAKGMGGNNNDNGQGIAVDDTGNVYVTGNIGVGTAEFNPGGSGGSVTSAGSNDVFLAKYDAGGNFLWAKSMGGTGAEDARAVAIDHAGNVYVTGGFKSATADFNPGGTGGSITLTGSTKNGDIFLAKYAKDGNFLWVNKMGGAGNNQGYGVAVDGTDNVYVTGAYSATAEFDPTGSGGTLTAVGGNDIFLAKYDAGGNLIRVQSIGGSAADHGMGVAIDRTDNVLLTGYFASATLDFNPGGSGGVINNTGGSIDIFLAKYDSSGGYLWAKSMGGAKQDHSQAIAVDGVGNIYITGTFESLTADFNPGGSGGMVTNAGAYNIFVAKYDREGNHLWAKGMGGSGHDWGLGVTADGNGNAYVSGYFSSATADFNPGGGGGTLATAGGYDGFVVKFACVDTSSSYLTVATCEVNYTFNDSIYTSDGLYTRQFRNTLGCDSTVTLDLSFYQLDPIITTDSFTLGVNGSYATYQWINNNVPIPGATGSTYTVTANGDYQVAVTNESGCADTSEVYPITNYTTGIETIAALAAQINIYPNPTDNIVYIEAPGKVKVTITDIQGRAIGAIKDAGHLSLNELTEGIYLFHITDGEGRLIKVAKVVKQRN